MTGGHPVPSRLMDFVPLIAAALIVAAGVDILRNARGKDWNSVITQLVSWGVGIGVAVLLAGSDFADAIKLGDTGVTLGSANTFSVVLFGMFFGATANKLVDTLKAIDNTDSQKKPPLVG